MNDHETEDLFKPRESERISRKDTVHVKAIVAILGMLFLIAIGYLVLLDPILDFFDKARGVSRKEPVGEDNEGMIPLGEIQSIPLPHARAEAVIPEKIYEKNPVVPSPAPVTPKKTEPEKKTVKTEPEPAVKEQMETEPAMMKDFQKKMNILRETYENNLRQTKEQHLEKDIALRETYTSGLLMLMDKLQRNGNLDYWVSIRDELNRFKKEGTIPEDDSVETLPEIKHIRREYQQVLAKQAAINSSEIILLCENYIHHLKSLQTQLTMDDRIGDALEVRAVIKKMEEGPELQSARFELAVYETNLKKAREQMTVTPDKETKGTETAAKTENPPESENIHKQAKETTKPSGRAENDKKYSEISKPVISSQPPPPPAGVTFSKLTMWKVEERPSRAMQVVVMVGNSSNLNTSVSNHAGVSSRLDEISIKHHVRIAAKANLRRFVQHEAVAVLQYFAVKSDTNPEKDIPNIIASDYFVIPEISETGIYIDCPPVETYKSSFSYNTSSFSRLLDTESVLSGLIITIFDSRGRIALQAVSHKSLKPYGIKELPRQFSP